MRLAEALAGLLAAVSIGAAAAQPPAGGAADPAGTDDVKAWLTRIHQAAWRRNFRGTFVVSAAGIVSSTRIVNYCQGSQRIERTETLDGQQRQVLRHNDLVRTLWPARRLMSVEQRDALATFPALLQGPGDARLAEHYTIETLGADRVAGHEATVLQVVPRDDLRFGYRLWVERDSSLLLRADVVGGRGEVLESTAFSELAIGIRPHPEALLQPLRRLDGWRVVRPAVMPADLAAEGWTLRAALPGFREIGCVKRPIAGVGEDAEAQVLQSLWSDGLSYVSVFVERFDPARHLRPMQTAIGATHTLMRRHGDWWVTVMGEVPAATLSRFAQALERR